MVIKQQEITNNPPIAEGCFSFLTHNQDPEGLSSKGCKSHTDLGEFTFFLEKLQYFLTHWV